MEKTVKEKDKKTKENFFKELKQEWKKISWNDTKTVCKQTSIVFITSIILSSAILGIDSIILHVTEFLVNFP